MSVVKSKRKQSQFEVFHHLTKMRQRITDLLLRDFGYSFEKFNKKLEKRYGGKPYEELTDTQKHDYERQKKRNESFDWTIDTATLWKPWHSRKPEYALPWEAPTGAHDIYKSGEYMIWTDGNIYKCVQDTNFSPVEYAQAWEIYNA